MWTDIDVVLIDQEFTIGFEVENQSSVSVARSIIIRDDLYVDGEYKDSLVSNGLTSWGITKGNFKISLDKPGTHIIEIKADDFLESYEEGEITMKEFISGILLLANYSDKLSLLSSRIEPEEGLEQFDRYIMVGTQKLSVALWNIWVGLIGRPYIVEGKELLVKSQTDLVLRGRFKNPPLFKYYINFLLFKRLPF